MAGFVYAIAESEPTKAQSNTLKAMIKELEEHCLYTGHSLLHPDSIVAVSLCDGIVSHCTIHNCLLMALKVFQWLFVEPLVKNNKHV